MKAEKEPDQTKLLLLLGDDIIDWSAFDKQSDHGLAHIQVMQLARVSLTNWLLSRQ
jgi:hypothetical protein